MDGARRARGGAVDDAGGIAHSGRFPRTEQTWPATADLPEDGTREQARVAVPAAATTDPAVKATALRRQRLLVLAGIGMLAVLGGVVLLLLTAPSDQDDPPAEARPVPTATAQTGAPGAGPVASGGARSLAPSRPAAGRSATAPRTATATGTPARTATTPAAPGAPAPTLSPPPDPARTGPIVSAGGRCLALGSLLGRDGSPVQTTGCSGASYQRWTLASDGTLRVTDRCALVGADAAVRIGGCDDQPAGQWRAGPNGSLVNPGTGRCLTDPGSLLTTVTVTDCTGAADQRWTLP